MIDGYFWTNYAYNNFKKYVIHVLIKDDLSF